MIQRLVHAVGDLAVETRLGDPAASALCCAFQQFETRLVDPALVRAASRSNSGDEAGRSSASACC